MQFAYGKNMAHIRILIVITLMLSLFGCATSTDITRDSNKALESFFATHPEALKVSKRAKGILVFPDTMKASWFISAQIGAKGVLLKEGKPAGYYNLTAASIGAQVGVETSNYIMFFMDDDALSYLDHSHGWEFGTVSSVVFIDKGYGTWVTTSTAKDSVYSYISGQKGLLVGLAVQFSKINSIEPEQVSEPKIESKSEVVPLAIPEPKP